MNMTSMDPQLYIEMYEMCFGHYFCICREVHIPTKSIRTLPNIKISKQFLKYPRTVVSTVILGQSGALIPNMIMLTYN